MPPTMTKTQLVHVLAEKTGVSKKTANAFLDVLAETAIKETKKTGVFVIPGLGRLVRANRKARMGRNPQTSEPIKIAAKQVVKFRVAKSAKLGVTGRGGTGTSGGDDGPPMKMRR